MKKLSLILAMVISTMSFAFAQRTVTGMISDTKGDPMVGASILVKGTTTGTISDVDGKYSLKVPAGATTLSISFAGFQSQDIALGASNVVDVSLAESVLQELVVTALGLTRSEKSISYAVQQLDGSKLTAANETNMVNSLSGKVAGLQVTSSTGVAGASSFFLIRGARSITGDNQPLIVIDGMPIDNQQLRTGAATASVANSNRGIDINQNDIASISVLKGAAATALYGSLAGNGAILITTKTGKKSGKIQIEFNSTTTTSQVNQLPELQTTYSQGTNGRYSGPQTANAASWGARIDSLRYANDAGTYAFDKNGSIVGQSSALSSGKAINIYDRYAFYQTAQSFNNNVSISAGNERSDIRLSLGFLNEKGIVPLNTFNKINIGLTANTKFSDKLKVGTTIQYINSGGTRIEQGSNTSGVMLGLLRTPATFDNSNGNADAANDPSTYAFANGSQRTYRGVNGAYDNPYWTVNNNPLKDEVNRVIGSFNINYAATDWLTLAYRPGIDFYSDVRKQHFAINSATNRPGRVLNDDYSNTIINADFTATIRKQIIPDLDMSLTLGNNMYKTSLSNLYAQGDNLVINGFYDLSNASGVQTIESLRRKNKIGYYTAANFAYKNFLYIDGAYRYDQSTTLLNRGYSYFSFGGSLLIDELLKIKSDVFTYGKLRASYGKVGNDAAVYKTSDYFRKAQAVDGWTDGISFPFGGLAGFQRSNIIGNPNLLPESNATFEVGADLRFFKNRVNLDFTYYSNKSVDNILDVPVTASSGYNNISLNSGEVTNKGIEAVLNLIPVQTKDFEWRLGFNFTKNVNEVTKLADGVDQVFLGGFEGSSSRAVVGKPYGTIFGFGFYRDAANQIVIGSNGFPILDPEERAFASAQPDFTLGINNSISYKGFTLEALLDIKQGGSMWNGTRSALYFFGTHKDTETRGAKKVFAGNVAVEDANGEVVIDPTTKKPKTTGTNTKEVTVDQGWLRTDNGNGFFGSNTEDFIESTSWVRLRNVSLSYALPSEFTKKVGIAGASLSVSGRNLFLKTPYTGVDPETSLVGASNAQGLDYFNMPNTKSYTVSLNLRF